MQKLSAYRVLIVVLVTALAVIYLPSDDDGSSTLAVSSPESGASMPTRAGSPDASVRAGEPRAMPGADDSTSTVRGSAGDGAPDPGNEGSPGADEGTDSSTGPAVPTSGEAQLRQDGTVAIEGIAYPGLGSQAALENPNCDPATGRNRIPMYTAAPCVAKWPAGADNLGATYQGVTEDAIRIVITQGQPGTTSTEQDRQNARRLTEELIESIEQHSELWGRKIEVIWYERTGSDEVAQRADAVEIANKYKPFMVVDPTIAATPYVVSSAELAARGILVWDHQTPWTDSQALAPFRWGVGHDDRLFAEHIAEFVGKSLAGNPAQHAGDPTMHLEERRFGLIYPSNWDIRFFDDAAATFGLDLAAKVEYEAGDTVGYQESSRVHIAKLEDAGVNNVIAAAELFYLALATPSATQANYFPEWTLTGWGVSDVTLGGRLYDKAQVQNMFGIGPVPVIVDSDHQVTNRVYAWHHGRQPDDTAVSGTMHLLFEDIFLGLQGAGPYLTPETFRNAMFATPPMGGYWCDCVTSTGESFGHHLGKPWDDYSSWDDMTMKWWKADEQSEDEIGLPGAGTWVMVDHGKRYIPGTYPDQEPPFFVAENISHHVDWDTDMPEREKIEYEHDESLHIIYGDDG